MTEDKKEQRLQGLVTVASELMEQYGYRKTSLNDVARKARVGKATLYHYVKNKEELFTLVVKRHLDGYLAQVKAIAARDESPLERLRDYALFLLKYHHDVIQRYGDSVQEIQDKVPLIFKLVKSTKQTEIHLLSHILQDGVREEMFEVSNVESAAALITSACRGMVGQLCEAPGLPQDKLVNDFLTILLNGIRSRKDMKEGVS